ncbi:hypothetical protein [Flavobacterium sp.]|uniref:hypothetical protein n=1 Tax=Flavobacterium sp. TaxID=239 RepID=UPI002614DEF1|nr:hypothetical protein [Flavobacterium sp.]
MKNNALYTFVILTILLSCNDKSTETAKEIKSQKQLSEKVKQVQPEKVAPELNLFPDIILQNFPKVDSTNFNNFKEENKLTDAQIAKLHLNEINPDAEHFYTRYKLSFSKNFETLAVTATSEMEMKTYLINYDKDFKLKDHLQIAYDEIAESWMWTIAKIESNKIQIEEHNASGQQDEVTKETYLVKDGKFIKKSL